MFVYLLNIAKKSAFFTMVLFIGACSPEDCYEGCQIADSEEQTWTEQLGNQLPPAKPVTDFANEVVETGAAVVDENVEGKELENPVVEITNGDTTTVTLGSTIIIYLNSDNATYDSVKWYYDLQEDTDLRAEHTDCPDDSNGHQCTFTSTHLNQVGTYIVEVEATTNYPDTVLEQTGFSKNDGKMVADETKIIVEAAKVEETAKTEESSNDDDDSNDDSSISFTTLGNLQYTSDVGSVPRYYKFTPSSNTCSPAMVEGAAADGSTLHFRVYTSNDLSSDSYHGGCEGVSNNFNCDSLVLIEDTPYYISLTGTGSITSFRMGCSS